MFEQSMLLDHATGRRTGALAASLTSQALLVGLLLLVPLIYHDRLPTARPWTPVILPPRPLPPPPDVVTAASPSPRPSFPARPVFLLPAATRQPAGPVVISPSTFEPDALPADEPAVPGWMPLHRNIVVSAPPASPIVTLKSPERPRPVGGGVQAAKLIKKVVPAYPVLARQARVSGTVRLVGVVARDGTVQRLEVESGHPLLVRAALEAVRQWVYRPTLLNGEAVEVIAPIDVIFTLSQ